MYLLTAAKCFVYANNFSEIKEDIYCFTILEAIFASFDDVFESSVTFFHGQAT